MPNKGYDSQCGELAQHFLSRPNAATPDEEIQSLAQAIQDAIEDWFCDRDNPLNMDEPSPAVEKAMARFHKRLAEVRGSATQGTSDDSSAVCNPEVKK